MLTGLSKSIKNMDDDDLFIKLSTKSHVLLFLTDVKEIDVIIKEINIIKYEIKERGKKIGITKETEKRRH